jgi:hypothetical protein
MDSKPTATSNNGFHPGDALIVRAFDASLVTPAHTAVLIALFLAVAASAWVQKTLAQNQSASSSVNQALTTQNSQNFQPAATQPVAQPATQPATTQPATQPSKPLTSAQIDQIMSLLKAAQPDTYHKAMELKRSDPNKFTALINKAAPSFMQLEALQQSDPVLFKLTLQDLIYTHHSFQLANELRQPGLNPDDAQRLRDDLTKVVTEQFDLRQQIRQHELDQLTTKINDLKAQLDAREKQRQTIIQNRVNDLIGNPPSADW